MSAALQRRSFLGPKVDPRKFIRRLNYGIARTTTKLRDRPKSATPVIRERPWWSSVPVGSPFPRVRSSIPRSFFKRRTRILSVRPPRHPARFGVTAFSDPDGGSGADGNCTPFCVGLDSRSQTARRVRKPPCNRLRGDTLELLPLGATHCLLPSDHVGLQDGTGRLCSPQTTTAIDFPWVVVFQNTVRMTSDGKLGNLPWLTMTEDSRSSPSMSNPDSLLSLLKKLKTVTVQGI